MSNFELAEEKLEVVSKCIEYAKERFKEADSPRYGEVRWWDDGDFKVRIVHGAEREGEEHRSEEILYKASDGKIIYTDTWRNLISQEIRVEDSEVLEEIEIEGDYE